MLESPAPSMRIRILPIVVLAHTIPGCAVGSDDEHVDEEASRLFSLAWEEQAAPQAALSCSGVVVPDRGPFDKVVALTFDDGPNPQTTPLVLDTLRSRGIPATFFINGTRVSSDAAEEIVADVASDDTLILGNHTWSHPRMIGLPPAAVASQIDDNTAVLVDAGETQRFFRFPYGAADCALTGTVRNRGYAVTGWHVDSADWCFSTPPVGVCPPAEFEHVDDDLRDDMVGFVLRQVESRQGGIILFHDIHAYTASQLPIVIDRLEAEGYTFTSIDDPEVFPLLNDELPTARTTANLNLRTGPGTQHSIILVMPLGSIVTLLAGPSSNFYQVDYSGTVGWASATYLQLL
jgi:peptidoglycan/xylan/chitin deacetylase (PgdA/CDA1 family)